MRIPPLVKGQVRRMRDPVVKVTVISNSARAAENMAALSMVQ